MNNIFTLEKKLTRSWTARVLSHVFLLLLTVDELRLRLNRHLQTQGTVFVHDTHCLSHNRLQ